MAKGANKRANENPCETSPASPGGALGGDGLVSRQDAEPNSGPATPSSQVARRRGMKTILLVLGLSGVATLGGGAVINPGAKDVISRAIVQKV